MIKIDMNEAVFLCILVSSLEISQSQVTMLTQTIKRIICNANNHLHESSSSLKKLPR